jgi:hypothetical protein
MIPMRAGSIVGNLCNSFNAAKATIHPRVDSPDSLPSSDDWARCPRPFRSRAQSAGIQFFSSCEVLKNPPASLSVTPITEYDLEASAERMLPALCKLRPCGSPGRVCHNHFVAPAGLAGSDVFESFSFANESSTRFLKSPASSSTHPL